MALEYHKAGWFPVPLQPRGKELSEKGVTGRKNEFPEDELGLISEWLGRIPKDSNIGLWLREGVIGIDVDNYNGKEGYKTLKDLEKKYGKLPDTWISSARTDGKSGIRYFRVPKGLVWPGKLGAGIDIIYRGYRYVATYPSHHPDTGGTYTWYRPGTKPNGEPDLGYETTAKRTRGGYSWSFSDAPKVTIPRVESLPELPKKWLDGIHLGEETDRPMDITSNIEELDKWVKDNLCQGKLMKSKWCNRLVKSYEKRVQEVKDDPSSHDKITAAHWEFIALGVEGHKGWNSAMLRFDKFWTRYAIRQGKRGVNEAGREIFRSKYNAIRQQKAKVEAHDARGVNLRSISCACFSEDDVAEGTSQGTPGATGKASAPNDYRMNDDGNAQHLHDLYPDNLIYVPGYGKFMFWNGERWIQDEDGLARRCFWKVRDRQEAYVSTLYEKVLAAMGDKEAHDEAKRQHKPWADFARRSGSNIGANAALEALQAVEGVSVNAEKMDQNERLLGVENGVLELREDGPAVFRKAKHDDYVTVNTGVPYIEPMDLAKAGGDLAKGRQLWAEYLDRFIPDLTLRRFIQEALGYCLLGTNEQRLAIFLYGGTSTGKSTMLNAVMAALGGYAETVDLAIFKEKASGLNPALAQAMPRRIITSSEAGMQNHMHADLFKRMTGNDRISAELKGVNVIVTRIPAFTPLIATNSPPTIKGADAALQKRLLILPFNETVDEEKDNKSASLDLGKYAAPIVLNWLVEGWRLYAKNGLNRKNWPSVVKESGKEFGAGLNDMGMFLADATEEVPYVVGRQAENSGFVTVQDMFDAYVRWATDQRISEKDIYNKPLFGRQLKQMIEQAVVKIEGNPTRVWKGRKLVQANLVVKFNQG